MNKLASILFVLLPGVGLAGSTSPYAGEEQRQITSLSQSEIESLRRGDGMGFAKLAELNHFPGPKHVLEIADSLQLSPSQLDATERLFEEMQSNAVALGEELLSAEADLDTAFKNGSVTDATLKSALLDIGRIRAQLRYVHLETHLRQKQILTADQIDRYDAARGYHAGHGQHVGSEE